MKYRPEIDGVRALAVMSVILFHADISGFGGGYVGVDIFFVISGYLITLIILNEQSKGEFTLINFYERRARRILPALFFVVMICLPFSWGLMNDLERSGFYKSITATSLFSSNILFWRESDYFAQSTKLIPLLHTWSLALEEQFYLFFPPLILFLWKWGRRFLGGILAIMGLISLGFCVWSAFHYPVANFYLLPFRLWELLAGSLVAFYFFTNTDVRLRFFSDKFSQLVSLFGLGLITFSVFYFDEHTPCPSLYTLVPVIGTALIIMFANAKNLTGRLLSSRFLVQIGLASYSTYLWHQPLYAFARLEKGGSDSVGTGLFACLCVAVLTLGYLTWKYVEQPFRDREKISKKFIARAAVAGLIIGASLSGVAHVYIERTSAPIKERLKFNLGLSHRCAESVFKAPLDCQTSPTLDILVWGDSFAMQLVDGIIASNPRVKLKQATKATCGPIVDLAPVSKLYPSQWADECIHWNHDVLAWLKDHPEIRTIVISSPFEQYFNNKIRYNKQTIDPNYALLLNKFKKTLRILTDMGIQPIVFSPPPTSGENLAACLIGSVTNKRKIAKVCEINYANYRAKNHKVIRFLQTIDSTYPVIWLDRELCDSSHCIVEIDGVYLYRDSGHLSIEGSKYLGKKMNFSKLIADVGAK